MIWKTKFGRCIYESSEGTNVYQNYLYRWLTLGSNAIQTLIDRRHPHRPGLNYIHPMILAARAQQADCCILGLGGAGIAHALKPYLANSQIVAVESSRDVIDTARSYFMTEQLKNLTIAHQDANIFVQQCQIQYQHLFVDIYGAYSFPAHCGNENFFSHCRRLLLPGGIIAVNLVNMHEQWPVFETLRKTFNDCTVSVLVKGAANIIVFACNTESVSSLLKIIQKNGQFKQVIWDIKWGCLARL